MQRPRVQEVRRAGAPEVGVLSGPSSDDRAGRLDFDVCVGDVVGRCFINRAEALELHQLTPVWVERALLNLVLRHGRGEVLERVRSTEGLEIKAADAADLAPAPFHRDRSWADGDVA